MSEYDDLVERLAALRCKQGCSAMRRAGKCASDDGACILAEPIRREVRECLSEIHAAGLRIVPSVPTEAMIRAVLDSSRANGSPLSKGFPDSWLAAVSASPYAPSKDK
jgi:hypothetical protein